jgi:hypothetical protein
MLPGLRTVPQRARMLGGDRRDTLTARRVDAGVVVSLPERASDPVCSVLALDFAGEPEIAGD